MSALFILLAVGALIGTWNMAGTIPTVVYYGLGLLSATWFYPATAIVCGLVGLAIGSSWTTAATLGVAFVALAPLVGADPAITAGAVISGAYFGDKMTPVSETTVLVPSMVGGVTTNEHIGAMVWTSGPSVVIALVLFTILGLATPATGPGFDPASAQATLASEFSIGLLNLLPLVLLVIFSIRRVPPFLAIFSCALFAGVLASFTQPALVAAFVNEPGQGPVLTGIEATYAAMATGFVSTTGNETIDTLFSRGGMDGMLTTIWLILGALSYAAIMEEAGFLDRLIMPIVARAKTTGRLIAAVIGTCIGLNIIAGDQYVAIVMPSRVYRVEFAKRGIAPRMLSRAVEDSGTVTSPLVPWNSCGAYMAAALGVATIAYLPFCFFNLASPGHLALLRLHRHPDRARPADRRATGTVTGHPPDGVPAPGGRARMTAAAQAEAPGGGRRGFALPSAYTILFILIVLTAVATYLIPAGAYDVDADGEPIPGTYHQVDQNPQRIVVDSLMAPINGLYGIEAEDGSISVWNSGELFGAIDVALFILVIGGFLGVTMKTGAIAGRDLPDRPAAQGPRAPDDPDPHDRLRDRRHDLRDGRGEPRLLRADHHGHDRRRLRLAGRRVDPAARLRHRRPRLDDQPVRDRHRLGLRGRVDRGGHRRAPGHPRRRHGDRDRVRHALRRARQGRPRRVARGRPDGRRTRPSSGPTRAMARRPPR